MLYNATGFEKIYAACGYTDLRRGIDGLASVVQHTFNLDPFQKNVLFMFCGRKNNRIKCLVWEGDGFIKAANDAHMGVIGIEYQISRLGVTPSNRRTVAVLRSGPAAMQNAGTITAFACSLVPIPSLQRLCRMIQ